MKQNPLDFHNTYLSVTKKFEQSVIKENTKPYFYELEKYNDDWLQTFQKTDLFDQVLAENLKNNKFTDLIFNDDFASNLQLEIQESKDKLSLEVLVQFNNFMNDLFFGNVISIDSASLKQAISNIDPEIYFSNSDGVRSALSILCDAIFSVFPEKLDYYRKKDSVKFKKEMKEVEFKIKDLKEQFFVDEIRAVFSLIAPPDQLLFVLKALAFVMTDRVIEWKDKGFSMKEICDFLLRLKPWTITKKQREHLKKHFLSNELWDLNKVAKQSHPGAVMAKWLMANIEAAELLDNVKTQAKHFKIAGKFDYSYFRLPGGVNFAFVDVKVGFYPRRGSLVKLIYDELVNHQSSLNLQGFKNKFLNPAWLLINSTCGISLSELESHRQDRHLILSSLITADGGIVRHEVSVNSDTGYLYVVSPSGDIIRVSDIGPFRVNCMLYC